MKENKAWIYKVFLLTFIVSSMLSLITNGLSSDYNLIVVSLLLLITIAIGILFDMIGIAILTSKPSTFNSIASQRIKGGKETLNLIKNGSKISSICNDVVGDVCGIISGTLGAILTIGLTTIGLNALASSTIVTAFIASLTVGGKAIGKELAVKHADDISFFVGKVLSLLALK